MVWREVAAPSPPEGAALRTSCDGDAVGPEWVGESVAIEEKVERRHAVGDVEPAVVVEVS
jgi:hypothetical protein